MSKRKDVKIPKGAKAIFKKRKIKPRPVKVTDGRHTKEVNLYYNDDYNALQGLSMVRRYIMWKYELTHMQFEMLLYLTPFQFFTGQDFKEIMANDLSHNRIKSYVDKGIITRITTRQSIGCSVYTISRPYRIVHSLIYKYLTGEKKIPEHLMIRFSNTMHDSTIGLTRSLIKKLSTLHDQDPSQPHAG